MISAPIGSMPKVMGSSIAIVATGPTPGSTPTSVPMRQPRKQKPTFFRLSATPRPSERLLNKSGICAEVSITENDGEKRNRQFQHELEKADAKCGHENSAEYGFDQAALLVGECRDDPCERPGRCKAECADCRSEDDH